MIFQYGSYSHEDNEVSTVFRQSALFDQRGERRGLRKRLELKGVLLGTSQADLTTKMNALEAAYLIDAQNARLLLNNGAVSHHSIVSSQSLTGVRVVQPPSFQPGDGAEYTLLRTYSIVLEADFLGSSTILNFEEAVTIQGTGGQRFAYLETLNTLPVRQVVNSFTLVRMTQSGSAVGLQSYPFAPSPLWPALEDLGQRTFIRRSPRRNLNGFTDFPISWTYKFTSDVGQDALPNRA